MRISEINAHSNEKKLPLSYFVCETLTNFVLLRESFSYIACICFSFA